MKAWIVWSLLALFIWGIWGLLPKLALKYIDVNSALFYEALGSGACGVVLALCAGGKPEFNSYGALFAALTGVMVVVGSWFYLFAARDADISYVVVLTAMYPIITTVLAVIVLKEQINARQIAALVLALGAIFLLATDSGNVQNTQSQHK